jgi:hypothetical protein
MEIEPPKKDFLPGINETVIESRIMQQESSLKGPAQTAAQSTFEGGQGFTKPFI